MGLVTVTQVQDNDEINPSSVNTPVNQIAAEFNGSVDNDNIANGAAISGSKLADASVTNSKLATGAGEPGGAWVSYTPTISGSGSAVGNGTLTGWYNQIGKTVFARIEFILGSTSTVGADLSFALPVTANDSHINLADNSVGSAYMKDATAGDWYGIARIDSSTTTRAVLITTSGTYPAISATSSSIPFTWTTNDAISLGITYEAA